MMFLVLVMAVVLLPAPGDFKAPGFPKCPDRCPKGTFQTEVLNSEGVLVCICKDPCEGLNCGEGETCVLETVYCFRAPCPPLGKCVKAPICKYGPPEMDESGKQVFCGRGPTRQDCSPGYKCNIHPTDRYAVCCPIKKEACICKHGPPQCDKWGKQVYCGRGGQRCARGYECKTDKAVRYAVCCPKPRCPRGQVWNDCGSACTATCREPNPICMEMCVPRCECPKNRPILHCGRCIRRAQCPRRRH